MPPSFVIYRRFLARYSLAAVALCVYTAWIHGYAASRSPRVDINESAKFERHRRSIDEASDVSGDGARVTSPMAPDRPYDVINGVSEEEATSVAKMLPSQQSEHATTTAAASAANVAPFGEPPTTELRTPGALSQYFAEISSTSTTTTVPTSTTTAYRPEQLIVHITWFYPPHTPFRFHEAICLLAVQRFVRPRKILFWYDAASTLPAGPWWLFARQSVAHLLPVPMDRPTSIYNQTVAVPEHQSDLARIDVLERHGGLYVDLDVIIVRPVDELVRAAAEGASVVMGAESPDMLGSGFILSPRPGAEFLALWRKSYADGFDDADWNRHSVFVPMKLARQRPDLVRIEWFSINRPNWNERHWLYAPGALWDWSSNYAVHLWFRDHPVDTVYDPVTIRRLNTTTGEVLRHIYYEHTDLLPEITSPTPHVDVRRRSTSLPSADQLSSVSENQTRSSSS